MLVGWVFLIVRFDCTMKYLYGHEHKSEKKEPSQCKLSHVNSSLHLFIMSFRFQL